MVKQFRFEKILSIKIREKDETLSIYNQTVKKFEEAAEKLYELLKKKEELEKMQSKQLLNGLSIQVIRHNQQFINNLEKMIAHYQNIVVSTRNHMNFYQDKLIEKNMEVKKYEKMKEKDKLIILEEEKQLEGKIMDDISIQQYMYRES